MGFLWGIVRALRRGAVAWVLCVVLGATCFGLWAFAGAADPSGAAGSMGATQASGEKGVLWSMLCMVAGGLGLVFGVMGGFLWGRRVGRRGGGDEPEYAGLSGRFEALTDAALKAARDRREAQAMRDLIMNAASEGVLVLGGGGGLGRALEVNKAFTLLFHFEREGVLGKPLAELVGEASAAAFASLVRNAGDLAGDLKDLGAFQATAVRANGESFPVQVHVSALSSPATAPRQAESGDAQGLGNDALWVLVFRDLSTERFNLDLMRRAKAELEDRVAERTTQLKEANRRLTVEIAEKTLAETELRKARESFKNMFEHAPMGVYMLTPQGEWLAANPALASMLGRSGPAELLAEPIEQVFPDRKRRGELLELLENDGVAFNFESQAKKPDGTGVWVSEHVRRVLDASGTTSHFEGFLIDVDAAKATEAELTRRAFHDPLTGLPNRRLFLDHVRLALERSERRSDHRFAVLYLDLDRFKIVNDSLGHEVGDELLKAAAGVLKDCVRDLDTTARFGGDEFAVLLEELQAPRSAVAVAKRILDGLKKPFMLKNHEVYTGASIGVVLPNAQDYKRPEEILHDADSAMYHAKHTGKARFKVFSRRMHEDAKRQLALEVDLRRALDRDEFFAVYQPLVRLSDFKCVGVEAFLRWRRPGFDVLLPEAFIRTAEDAGLMPDLGVKMQRLVAGEAVCFLDLLEKLDLAGDEFRLSLNVSQRELVNPDIASKTLKLFADYGLPSSRLAFDMTEAALTDRVGEVVEAPARLRKLGAVIRLDDFGVGRSSLGSLKTLPIDAVKIDKSFVGSLENDDNARAIVRSVTTLGRSMNLGVLAEGVETGAQLDFLIRVGCGFAQGNFFAAPTEAQGLAGLLGDRRLVLSPEHAPGSAQIIGA